MPRIIFVLGVLLLLFFSSPEKIQQPSSVIVKPETDPFPANIPYELRQKNWVRHGSGSCFHASIIVALRWCNNINTAKVWPTKYGGGEYTTRLSRRLTAEGVTHIMTDRGDPAVLEYASETGRAAAITYFPRHAITFCGFVMKDGHEYSVVLDNNRIQNFIWIPKNEFIRKWKNYGGGALVPLNNPPPKLPWWREDKNQNEYQTKSDCCNCKFCLCSCCNCQN